MHKSIVICSIYNVTEADIHLLQEFDRLIRCTWVYYAYLLIKRDKAVNIFAASKQNKTKL